MKVNWGALGITIGLILVAVSILAVGLIAGRKLTVRLTTLEEQIPSRYLYIKTDIARTLIAQEYAYSKANSEKRAITLEDLKEGYALADKFMGK